MACEAAGHRENASRARGTTMMEKDSEDRRKLRRPRLFSSLLGTRPHRLGTIVVAHRPFRHSHTQQKAKPNRTAESDMVSQTRCCIRTTHERASSVRGRRYSPSCVKHCPVTKQETRKETTRMEKDSDDEPMSVAATTSFEHSSGNRASEHPKQTWSRTNHRRIESKTSQSDGHMTRSGRR
jgi:hypothetical protein